MTTPERPDVRDLAIDAVRTEKLLAASRFGDSAAVRDAAIADAVLAAVTPVIRRQALDEYEPEPCRLDHSCDEDEMCSCWCELHDCAIAECPTFKFVDSWLTHLRDECQAKINAVRARVAEEIAADLEAASGSLGWLPMRYDAAAIARSHTEPAESRTGGTE